MGDADCTYDFRELGDFVRAFEAGNEFVMGSRKRGYMDPGSNPCLHRYVGTPVTTWILNLFYVSRFSSFLFVIPVITRLSLVTFVLLSLSFFYASVFFLFSFFVFASFFSPFSFSF